MRIKDEEDMQDLKGVLAMSNDYYTYLPSFLSPFGFFRHYHHHFLFLFSLLLLLLLLILILLPLPFLTPPSLSCSIFLQR